MSGSAVRPVILLGAVLAMACTLTTACRGRSLTNGLDSPDAVAQAVVTALAAHDLPALERLAVSEDEFREIVWPQLPSSRPERNLTWDYVWKDLRAKSDGQLRARIRGWQDRGFQVVRIAFQGETTDYGTFRVKRKSLLTLRDRAGQETEGRLFGAIIEQEGRYKVFSYIVD